MYEEDGKSYTYLLGFFSCISGWVGWYTQNIQNACSIQKPLFGIWFVQNTQLLAHFIDCVFLPWITCSQNLSFGIHRMLKMLAQFKNPMICVEYSVACLFHWLCISPLNYLSTNPLFWYTQNAQNACSIQKSYDLCRILSCLLISLMVCIPYSGLFSLGVYFVNFEIAAICGINFREITIPMYLV